MSVPDDWKSIRCVGVCGVRYLAEAAVGERGTRWKCSCLGFDRLEKSPSIRPVAVDGRLAAAELVPIMFAEILGLEELG